MVGAIGANIGTHFLASVEAGATDARKHLVLETESDGMVRFQGVEGDLPSRGRGYDVVPRVMRTDFVPGQGSCGS